MADTYTVERSTTIQAPPDEVYAHVADFHRWEAWSPWADLDPAMTRTYTGPDSGTGAAYAWSCNKKSGQGRMEITEATAPAKVEIDLRFEKPFKSESVTAFSILPSGDGSEVTWSMTGAKTLPLRLFSIFKSMDALIGPDFEKGLARLKATVEG